MSRDSCLDVVHRIKYWEESIWADLLLNSPQVWMDPHSIEKWTGWDLNPRPLPCQDSDLPADLPAREPDVSEAGI